MKQLTAALLFIFLIPAFATAQLEDLGLDRSIGGPGHTRDTRKNKDNKFDFVQASADNMTKQLSLDTFQAAAIKNFIEDYKNAVVSVNALDIPDEAKNEKLEVEKNKMETKILGILNKEQIVKFQELKDKMDKKGNKKEKEKEPKE